uniref:Uncharacterized protein n=1 Tax=Arundo donax TaxID=35708 RepID=A0A0A9EG10_ARUDO
MGSCPTFPPRRTPLHGAPIFAVARATCTASTTWRKKRSLDAVTAWTVQSPLHPRFYGKQNATRMQIQ